MCTCVDGFEGTNCETGMSKKCNWENVLSSWKYNIFVIQSLINNYIIQTLMNAHQHLVKMVEPAVHLI